MLKKSPFKYGQFQGNCTPKHGQINIDCPYFIIIVYLVFMKQMNNKNELARFTNDFAFNAQIGFTDARQLLLFLALVSQTNPHDKDEPMTGILSINDIQLLTRNEKSKSKGIYKETQEFIDKMMENNFVKFIPTDIDDPEVRRHLKNYGVIFDRLRVMKGGEGTFYQYRFHEDMRVHIKELRRDFVSLTLPRGMKSGHAIRFLLLAKAHHDRLRLHKKVTYLKISLIDLKRILGIEKKYSVFADFRKRIIEPIVSEVNKSGLLRITDYTFVRTSRKVTDIEFSFQDGEIQRRNTKKLQGEQLEGQMKMDFTQKPLPSPSTPVKDFVPNDTDIAKLTKAQLLAYEYLLERKCKAGIIYRQIVQKTPSSEYLGWEDIFVQKAWERFEKRTKYKQKAAKAGAFIKWWMKGEFKTKLFAELMEEVTLIKKSCSVEQRASRERAKTMTASEFDALVADESKVKKRVETLPSSSGMTPVSELLQKYKPEFDVEQWKQNHAAKYEELKQRVIAEYKEGYGASFDLKRMEGKIEEKALFYARSEYEA